MAAFTTALDIINYALFNGGEPTDGTSDYASAIVDYLNRGYRDIAQGGGAFAPHVQEPWYWLKKDPPGVLTLLPAIVNVGSASATNNNTTVNFTVDPGAGVSLAGRFLKFDLQPDVFRILTHTAGSTSMTIDAGYTGVTASGLNYKIMALEYTLASDVDEILSPMRVQAGGMLEIDGVDLYSMDRDWPLARVTSQVPTQFAMVTTTKVRFNKYGFDDASTSLIRVEYDYLVTLPTLTGTSSEIPLIPIDYRHVLADICLYKLYIAKNDDRAATIGKQIVAGINAMSHENRVRMVQFGRMTGRLLSRNDNRVRVRAPLRTQSGIIIG